MCRGAARGSSRRGTAAGHPTLTGWLRLAPPRGAASSLGGRAATLRARLALAPGLECLPLHRESCKTLALMSRC